MPDSQAQGQFRDFDIDAMCDTVRGALDREAGPSSHPYPSCRPSFLLPQPPQRKGDS